MPLFVLRQWYGSNTVPGASTTYLQYSATNGKLKRYLERGLKVRVPLFEATCVISVRHTGMMGKAPRPHALGVEGVPPTSIV